MEKVYFNSDGWVCNRHPYNFEIDDENRYIELEELDASKSYLSEVGMAWRVENNELVLAVYDEELVDDNRKSYLRSQRAILLIAFDIYKTNVFYGIENDENHDIVISWYKKVLDMEEEAINNPPEEILKYL